MPNLDKKEMERVSKLLSLLWRDLEKYGYKKQLKTLAMVEWLINAERMYIKYDILPPELNPGETWTF
jgi:hypothetical protein